MIGWRVLVAGVAAAGLWAHAAAAESPGAAIAGQGLPAAGVPACATCHGASGEGNAAIGAPRLAGLPAAYLVEQLNAFAEGSRANPLMQPVAKGLDDAQRRAVATYFSGQPVPSAKATPASGAAAALGAALVERGRWQDGLPACAQCHGPGAAGVGTAFPPLAGQSAAYLTAQLNAWKSGARPAGPLGLMPAVVRKLSDQDIAAVTAYLAAPGAAPALAAGPAQPAGHAFQPPPESAIPNDEFGQMVRLGESIFRDTGKYASAFVGNTLTCENCHIDGGRLANASPMWAAYVAFPAYRAKNGHVNTFAERLQGCFRFSMNGKAPPTGDKVLVALETYSYWLAQGAPVGAKLPGRGYPKVAKPASAPDYDRGAKVYAQNCALCHGADGAGQTAGDKTVFPPLWGPKSFNWGAGMGAINNAAGFIKANMPLGKPGSLSDQDAWDVAMFIDSHERPQDPRFAGSIAETRAKFHNSPYSMYGQTVNGHLVGSGTAP